MVQVKKKYSIVLARVEGARSEVASPDHRRAAAWLASGGVSMLCGLRGNAIIDGGLDGFRVS
jgi:hypothetical protein